VDWEVYQEGKSSRQGVAVGCDNRAEKVVNGPVISGTSSMTFGACVTRNIFPELNVGESEADVECVGQGSIAYSQLVLAKV
jgi:hypothetical protein